MQYSQEFVEDLALAAVILVGYAQGKLEAPDIERIENVLNVWTDGFMSESMTDLIPYTQRKVGQSIKSGQIQNRFADALDGIYYRLHRNKLKIVMFDLLALVRAGGAMDNRKKALIEMVAQRWGFELNGGAYQHAA
jgi:hypothetical protein